tara:strand:+ start:1082 stop:1894 length:813 start_codon:yes stop_codon:yes gene_type:complete
MLHSKFNNLLKLKNDFLNNQIFPHIRLTNFLDYEICNKVNEEIDININDIKPYFSFNTKKYALNNLEKMGENTRKLIGFLNSKDFIKKLEDITGLKNLIADEQLEGGGIHITKKDGYLKVHADFESHIINKTWKRKINLLLYFNKDFKENYNANLELYSTNLKEKVSYLPEFNSAVIFLTDENSFHGHPIPFDPKKNEIRKSIALYYYIDEKKNLSLKETNFKPLPDDNIFKITIMRLDQILLKLFSFLKRNKLIKDDTYTNFIKFFKKK